MPPLITQLVEGLVVRVVGDVEEAGQGGVHGVHVAQRHAQRLDERRPQTTDNRHTPQILMDEHTIDIDVEDTLHMTAT